PISTLFPYTTLFRSKPGKNKNNCQLISPFVSTKKSPGTGLGSCCLVLDGGAAMHSLLNSALLIQFMISICILGREILMRQTKRRMILAAAVVFAWIGLFQIVLETYVDARAGGG